jgi:putative membrane protein
MALTPSEAEAIDARVAAVEAATGVEVVAALIGKADAYVELPWKAFALGASVAAFAAAIADAVRPDWIVAHAALKWAVAILAAGGASALAAVFVPGWARAFLTPARREVEVRQYAQALFLERELFRTGDRTGVLLLVSAFERRIEILPDAGHRGRIAAADWQEVVARMRPPLAAGRQADALLEGLAALQNLLVRKGYRRAAVAERDRLPNRPIDEPGVSS